MSNSHNDNIFSYEEDHSNSEGAKTVKLKADCSAQSTSKPPDRKSDKVDDDHENEHGNEPPSGIENTERESATYNDNHDQDSIDKIQFQFTESIREIVKQNSNLLNTVFQPRNMNSHAVLFFAPLWTSEISIYCKHHPECKFEDGGKWIREKLNRTLYDVHRNVFLISRKVNCEKCVEPYKSHDEHILNLLPSTMRPPFILSHKGGITTRAADLI